MDAFFQSAAALAQLVVFTLDEQRFALRLASIERIVRVAEITPLSSASAIVLGVVTAGAHRARRRSAPALRTAAPRGRAGGSFHRGAHGALDKQQIEVLAAALTIGETYFMRDPRSLEVLSHVFPELIRVRRGDRG